MQATHHAVLWVLDIRSLWQGKDIESAATDVLHHLSQEERDRARAYYFLKDAKLSVASSLLKRHFVANAENMCWEDITFRRKGDPKHGKPCYVSSSAQLAELDFNVSHQAGLTALAGCLVAGDDIGIDIVCVDERSHARMLQDEGFDGFVDMHRDVFSDADLQQIKYLESSAVSNQSMNLDARLRKFYAFWCIKEAYVKMVGEGLLDPWIRHVEFRKVLVPAIPQSPESQDRPVRGEGLQSIEVWLHGKRLQDVSICLEAFGHQYMIATAIRCRCANISEPIPRLEILDLATDILQSTQAS